MAEAVPVSSAAPPRWTGLHQEPAAAAGGATAAPAPPPETRKPHLVNYGVARATTAVTFIPLPERGRLVIGLPDRQSPPDVAIEGLGAEPSHAVLETDGTGVLLTPRRGRTTVNGIRCSEPSRLSSGSMLCLGRSHYFKYMCPAEYRPAAPPAPADYMPMCGSPPALDNPEYYHVSVDSEPACAAETPPPKPPRAHGAGAADPNFTCGEYLYTRMERPPVPPPVARGPPRDAPAPAPAAAAAGGGGGQRVTGPYDNVPSTRRGARPPEVTQEESRPLTEEELTLRHRQVLEERQRVEAVHQLEQSRLDKILHLCAEYDSRASAAPPVPAPRTPGSPAPGHSRIKTNGSLPRDRRLGSPGAVTSDSEEELSSGDTSASASGGAAGVNSPYENVSFAGYPQSPRTRIRTTVQRERLESGREASPPKPAVSVYQVPPVREREPAPPVYVVPPRPVPLRSHSGGSGVNGGSETGCLQFENKEYMRGLPLDADFQNDDFLFLRAPSAGAPADGPDVEAPEVALEEAALPGGHDWPDSTERDRETCRRLKEQRRMTYRQLSELRQQKLELEHQESESIRQLEMEHALLAGELETHAGRLPPLQTHLNSHRETLAERTAEWERTRTQRLSEAEQLASRVVAAEAELERLEQLSEQFRGSTDEETRLLERLKHQHELVEQERKAHEDQEFHHMEDQVGWETEKEESLRVIHELENKIAHTRSEMEGVREQQRSLIESIRHDAEAMEEQRREIVRQMCQEREKLRRTQRRLSGLSESGLEEAADDPALEEADLSSDPEELSNEYIASRLARLHVLGKSRDDLQRIHSVTASSPMQVDDRSSNTLREIERNRHVLLAKQGTQVIEEERRWLDELKRRVQSQVTEQWQQQRQQASGDASDPTGRETNGHPDTDQPVNGSTSPDGPQPISTNGESHRPISSGDSEQPPTHDGSQPISAVDPLRRPISGDNWSSHPISDGPACPRTSQDSPCRPTSDESSHRPLSGDHPAHRPISGEDRALQPTSEEDAVRRPVSDEDDSRRPVSGEAEEARPRPVSEASSVFDGVEEPVRRRQLALSPKQRPLTRYMPITDEQFDLRQHIESAGHQLEVCPGVHVSRHACRGYLHKQGGRLRGWQRRWFVFDRSRNKRTFMYFADKSEHKAKGGVFFQAIEEVYVDHLKPGRGGAPNTTFCVKTMSRTFFLMAASPEAMRIWVDVIMTGAEGHSAYGHA